MQNQMFILTGTWLTIQGAESDVYTDWNIQDTELDIYSDWNI